MEQLLTVDSIVAFLTLTTLEVVLGIDNVVFLAILAGKLPKNQQARARRVGLLLAMVMRILLLLAIGWVMGLTDELFAVAKFWTGEAGDVHPISGQDLIMLVGGLFLIGKATYEIHDKLEGEEHEEASRAASSFGMVIVQIMLIDMVFSLDSVITAIGMVPKSSEYWVRLTIMITAVVAAVLVMIAFAGIIARFVERHPTLKMLALSFLILIGVLLVAEAFHYEIPKGYVYFSMAFSLAVELLNLRMRKITQPVKLHQTYVRTKPAPGHPVESPAGEPS